MADERVLLVDDDPSLLSALRRQIGRKFAVSTATGGVEALEMLAEQGPFAVAVSDMRMPGMTGVQLFAEMERHFPDVVRIMLTGNSDQETAVAAVNAGHVFRFLNKPVPAEALCAVIESGLQQYRLVQTERELVRHAKITAAALEREKQAHKAQRDFVAMVSHEFRTPLAIIDSAIEILCGPYQLDPDKIAKRLNQIREQVKRMTELMDSTLSISRLEAGAVTVQKEPIDLKAFLQKIGDRQIQAARGTHQIRYDLEMVPAQFLGDAKLLDACFGNIISNAIKYSPGKEQIFIRGQLDGDYITVQVIDFGVGIPADEIPKLYDRFFRASTATGIAGSGIGLHIVRQFIHLHGGRVAIDSKVGAGTRVSVSLPTH